VLAASVAGARRKVPAPEITYINLDARTDRRASLEVELDGMGLSYTRTAAVTVNASVLRTPIKHAHRRHKQVSYIGCSLSHIKALEHSNRSVLVLEDDVTFRYMPNLRMLLRHDWWDVIAFAYNGPFNSRECRTVHGALYCKSPGFKTASAYLVRDAYRHTVIDVLHKSVARLVDGVRYERAANDVVWQQLAKVDRWFVAVPRIAWQRPSYSDIEMRGVDYGV